MEEQRQPDRRDAHPSIEIDAASRPEAFGLVIPPLPAAASPILTVRTRRAVSSSGKPHLIAPIDGTMTNPEVNRTRLTRCN
jgi:hypothetical protein